MRLFVPTLIGVAGVAAVAFFAFHSRTPHEPPLGATPTRAADARAPLSPPAPAAVPAEAKRTDEPIAAESTQLGGAPKNEPTDEEISRPASGVLVEGSVVVVDENGIENSSGNGTFVATYWTGHSGSGDETVQVKSGRFRLRVPIGVDLGVSKLKVDDCFARVDPNRIAIASDQPIVVRGQLSHKVLLHVVDAATREELRDVTVLWNDDWRTDRTIHPGGLGPGHTLAEHVSSPVETTIRDDGFYLRWQTTLYASAPGHAWGSARVDYTRGSDATLALSRSGDLEVTVVGDIPLVSTIRLGASGNSDAQAWLRLRKKSVEELPDLEAEVAKAVKEIGAMSDDEILRVSHGKPRPTEPEIRERIERAHQRRSEAAATGEMVAQVAPESPGPTRVAGLPPGPLTVRLERGDHFDKPLVLAQASIEIIEGGTVHATLTIDAHPEARKRVHLAGTVHYSDAWKSDHLDLRFEPVDVPGGTSVDSFELAHHDLHRVGDSPELFRFDAGQVLPGRYVVLSYTLEFQQVVDTGPEGTDQAAIVIGDPADIRIHFVDADSGQPFDAPPKLLWNCVRPKESTGGGLEHGEWDGSLHATRLRAPAGEIELSVDFAQRTEYEVLDPLIVSAVPGQNDFTLRIRRAISVVLGVTIDGSPASWPGWSKSDDYFKARLASADDPVRIIRPCRASQTELDFSVNHEGRYTVTFPTLKGFAPVAPFEVVARRGEKTIATVALRRVQ